MAAVVVNGGKTIIVNRLMGSGTEPKYLGWGTGAGTAAVGDTALFTAAAESRVTGTSSAVTTSTTNDTYQVTGTITSSSGQSITNVGLWDASSGGDLFVHIDHGSTPLLAGESIAYTIGVQFS